MKIIDQLDELFVLRSASRASSIDAQTMKEKRNHRRQCDERLRCTNKYINFINPGVWPRPQLHNLTANLFDFVNIGWVMVSSSHTHVRVM